MKNVLFIAFLSFSSSLFGQSDLLFSEKFDSDIAWKMALFPSGDDTTWVNFSEDDIPPLDPNLPKNWYWEVLTNDFATGEVIDYLFVSTSFLVGAQGGNRNWLILPPISIPDSTCRLFWRSTSFQGPAYHDGYKVLVSTETNFDYHFIDTLFQQAQMVDFTDDCSVDLADYTFSEGWIQANAYTDTQFFEKVTDQTGCMGNLGKLEPHSASLAKFAGQKIYVAFLHDSDDDFLIELDDVQILKNQVSASREPVSSLVFFEAGPNPTSGFLRVKTELTRSLSMSCAVFDALGRAVFSKNLGEKKAGATAFDLDLSGLETGVYFLKIEADGHRSAKTIFKI